jgi:hypothetical protein
LAECLPVWDKTPILLGIHPQCELVPGSPAKKIGANKETKKDIQSTTGYQYVGLQLQIFAAANSKPHFLKSCLGLTLSR